MGVVREKIRLKCEICGRIGGVGENSGLKAPWEEIHSIEGGVFVRPEETGMKDDEKDVSSFSPKKSRSYFRAIGAYD